MLLFLEQRWKFRVPRQWPLLEVFLALKSLVDQAPLCVPSTDQTIFLNTCSFQQQLPCSKLQSRLMCKNIRPYHKPNFHCTKRITKIMSGLIDSTYKHLDLLIERKLRQTLVEGHSTKRDPAVKLTDVMSSIFPLPSPNIN